MVLACCICGALQLMCSLVMDHLPFPASRVDTDKTDHNKLSVCLSDASQGKWMMCFSQVYFLNAHILPKGASQLNFLFVYM